MNEGMLQAFLDGELPVDERAAVGRHLRQCSACAAELELLRSAADELSAALRLLDRPAPVADARAAVAARVRRGGRSWRVSGVRRRVLLRAAVVVLAVSAVLATALPGSPVREWAAAAWHEATMLFAGDAAPSARDAERARSAGVSVAPVNGRARVGVIDPAPGTRLRVRLVDAERVSVRTSGAAAEAGFRTGRGWIEVVGGGPGAIVVELPRGLERAVVEVDGDPYLRKRGDTLRFPASPTERAEAEVVFRVGTGAQ